MKSKKKHVEQEVEAVTGAERHPLEAILNDLTAKMFAGAFEQISKSLADSKSMNDNPAHEFFEALPAAFKATLESQMKRTGDGPAGPAKPED